MRLQLLVLVLCAACASTKGSTNEEKRAFIDKFAEDSLARLEKENAEAAGELKKAPGYGAFKKTITKVPIVGAGGGYGVVVDNKTKARPYVKVREFQLGAGFGVKGLSTIVVFHTEKMMQKVRKGTWRIGASAGASAGDKGACGETGGGEDFTPYVFTDKGVSATATFNILRVTPYSSLNKK